MNDRQRDLFLWLWSQRRAPGAARVARRGALVGAGGGLLFCTLMMASMGPPDRGSYTGLSMVLPLIERASILFMASVPALTWGGWFYARRIFHLHEHMYQAMLHAGARVPTHKPALRLQDRWPAMAVGATVVVIAGFVLSLFWAASTGRL